MSNTATLTRLEQQPAQPAENSVKQSKPIETTAEQRRQNQLKNLRPWKPGQSGNPKGRPKKKNVLSDCLREVAGKKDKSKKKTHMELVALALFRRAESGNVEAAKLIIERLEGKAPDKLELSGALGQVNVQLTELLEIVKDDPERARQLAATLRASITDNTGS